MEERVLGGFGESRLAEESRQVPRHGGVAGVRQTEGSQPQALGLFGSGGGVDGREKAVDEQGLDLRTADLGSDAAAYETARSPRYHQRVRVAALIGEQRLLGAAAAVRQ